MKPWIDRSKLIARAKDFVHCYGYTLRLHAKRISSLVEVAVYNSIVSFYESQKYQLAAVHLGPKKSFKYRIKSTGLIESFSSFEATHKESGETILILQNVKVQSAHDDHLYYTPDVVVCTKAAARTDDQRNGKRHSYIANDGLITFVEVKHLIPGPEMLFSFSGLVLECFPQFILGAVKSTTEGRHLTPIIAFTGAPSEHSERIRSSLTKRYEINVVFGTQKTEGRLASFETLLKYNLNRTGQNDSRAIIHAQELPSPEPNLKEPPLLGKTPVRV